MKKALPSKVRKRILGMVDFGLVLASVLIAWGTKSGPENPSLWTVLPRILLISLVLQLSFYYNNLYNLRGTHRSFWLTFNLVQSFAVAAVVLGATYLLFPTLMIARGVFFLSIVFVMLLVFPWRFFYVRMLKRRGICDNILIVGTNGVAGEIARELIQKAPPGYHLAGFWTTNGKPPSVSEPLPVVSGTDRKVFDWLNENRINTVVAAAKDGEEPTSRAFLSQIQQQVPEAEVRKASDFYEEVTGKVLLPALTVADVQQFRNSARRRLAWHFKRLIDIVISLAGLVLTLPISIVTAIAIKLTSKGLILFAQERVGQNGNVFKLLKFRSMWHNAEANSGPVWAGVRDKRITPVGRVIRKFRIDEFPQMLNVLRGQMSFVGPRPERPYFIPTLEKEIPFYSQRHCVKPGLTGLAQVRHYYTSSMEETVGKLQYDLYYIKHMSPLLDFMILLDTVKTVMFGAGAR